MRGLASNGSSNPVNEPNQNESAEISDHYFWHDEDGLQVIFDNWGMVLDESHGKEMLSIRMQMKSPAIAPQVSETINPDINKASKQGESATIQVSAPSLRTPAFLEWPMRDEFGKEETLDVERRVSMFWRAIYLGLPAPNDMTGRERARYPQAVSEKRAQARRPLFIQPTTFAKLQENINVATSLGNVGQELLTMARHLMRLFVPLSHGADFECEATGIASFFGMNVQGTSNTTSDVGHFWEIALPLTGGIVIFCVVVAIKGEATYFDSTRAWRYSRGLCSNLL